MLKEHSKKAKMMHKGGLLKGFLFMAWVGALVYFVQHSNGFGGFLLAILKSIVWPACVKHRFEPTAYLIG